MIHELWFIIIHVLFIYVFIGLILFVFQRKILFNISGKPNKPKDYKLKNVAILFQLGYAID